MIIRLKRASKATWERKNPILASGELCVEKAEGARPARAKIGNGFAAWNDLPYSFESTTDENIESTIRAYLEKFDWSEISIGEKYTTKKPTEVDIGGIPAGTTFTNASLSEILNKLFFVDTIPTTGPTIVGNVMFTPATTENTFIGDNHSITSVSISVIKGSHNIASVIFMHGDKQLGEVVNKPEGGMVSLNVSEVVRHGSNLICIVTDVNGAQARRETPVSFNVRPAAPLNLYYGIATVNPALHDIDLTTLTKKENVTKANQTLHFNISGWVVFISPKEFGPLRVIRSASLDTNLIGRFTVQEINIDGIDYTVYKDTVQAHFGIFAGDMIFEY